MIDVLHVTHTNVLSDSRILKELTALAGDDALRVTAFGSSMADGGVACGAPARVRVRSFRLYSQGAKWLPRPARYSILLAETNVRFLLAGLHHKPDIVHCHDTMVLPAGAALAALTGCKLIYDAHELESNKAGQTATLAKATLAIERLAWRQVDVLISVSSSITRWYEHNLGPKPSAVILNAPQVGTASPGGSTLRDSCGIDAQTPVVVYVGALEEGRGIAEIMRAAERGSFHVVFVGSGTLFDAISDRASLSPRLHLLPPQPHDQLVSFISNADIGLCLIEPVSLSDYLCLPNKLFEYLQAGLPVVASDIPEVRGVVEARRVGVCTDRDAVSLANAVESCLVARYEVDASSMEGLDWAAQSTRLKQVYSGLGASDLQLQRPRFLLRKSVAVAGSLISSWLRKPFLRMDG